LKEGEETKAQLRGKLEKLRRRVAELEHAENERKRAGEALQEREEEYRLLFEQLSDALFLETLDGRILDVNESACQLLGYEYEELTKMTVEDLVPSGQPAFLPAEIDEATREGKPMKTVNRHKNGTLVPVELSGRILEIAGQTRLLVSLRDITERVRMEKALKNSLKRFEDVALSSADWIWEVDKDGKYIYVSGKVKQILGYEPEELIGKTPFELMPENEAERVGKAFRKIASEKKPIVDLENWNLTKAGEKVCLLTNGVPILDEKGELLSYRGVDKDITERVQAEEKLKLRFVNLAETVSRIFSLRNPYVATHQYGTAKLTRAVGEKMGLDENRLQSLYIGSLLHDIGKAAIPEGILRKPGELNEAERGLVRTHPQRGYDILKDADLPWPVAELALHHHERLDGSGYPNGLKGDELSMEVRILAVCNVVDAMSLRHPYRPARSKQEIIEEIKSGKGTRYDPNVVDVLVEMIENGELELATG
jgi:PAS domain S-box-containing protein